MQAAAVNKTSDEEFKPVSVESCKTLMIKPTATTSMATDESMPNKPQAKGINIKEPPGTPEVPQAQMEATKLKITAEKKLTSIFKLWAAANVNTVIVMAAPAILMVAPNGIVIEYVASSKFKRRHIPMLTGILAADERVKKAITPLSRKVASVNG